MKNKRLLFSCGSLCGFLAGFLPGPVMASTITGSLSNFDVVNNTHHETHGFEIEIHGISSHDVYYTFNAPYIRYGQPSITNHSSAGDQWVTIRYESQWDPVNKQFLQATPVPYVGFIPSSHSCWNGGLGSGYAASGCEHFGVTLGRTPTLTRYRWLTGNPQTGVLSAIDGDIGLPSPVWNAPAPAAPADPQVVQAEIEIPNPEGLPYGPAYWVKIYKTEANHDIALNNLLLDDPLLANETVEVEWELLQAKPGARLALNQDILGNGSQAVVRRYEFYEYNTAWGQSNLFNDNGTLIPYVDPANGEVRACVVDGCNAPTADELGNYIGRQIAGVNLQVQAVPLPASSLLTVSGLLMLLGLSSKKDA